MNPEGGKEKSIISPQTPAALLSKQGSPVSFSSTGRGNLAAHDVLLIERLSLKEMKKANSTKLHRNNLWLDDLVDQVSVSFSLVQVSVNSSRAD